MARACNLPGEPWVGLRGVAWCPGATPAPGYG